MAAEALAERRNKKKKAKTKAKKTKKTLTQAHEHNLSVSESEENRNKVGKENKQNSSMEKKRKREKEKKVDGKIEIVHGSVDEGNVNEARGNSQNCKSSTKKKRKSRDKANAGIGKGNWLDATDVSSFEERNGKKESESQGNILEDTDIETAIRSKSEKAGKKKKKHKIFINKVEIVEKSEEPEPSKEPNQDEVYQIPSLDGDHSKGMKKWLMEYHQNRPGFNILQQKIDDFITAHEEQEEQTKKEREARLVEGGWTVVAHHKGRKKTTDAESGTTMGSVAQAVVLDKLDKKKKKEVEQDFYRFQKREAQRSEIMKLQSKFEEDKKRIQQLRAARKFKPY